MGSFLRECHQLEVRVRMDIEVIVERDVGVQGSVDAACRQQLDGLFQRVDALHGSAVALGQLHVGGGQAVGRGLAVQVLKAGNAVVVFLDGERGVDVAVRRGEIVGLGAFLGDLHAVADHVITASVHAGKQAVPIALHIFRLHAQLLGNGAGDLDVVAHQRVVRVMEAPGLPCAFQRDDQLAVGLDGLQLVGGSSGSRSSGTGSSGGRSVGRAASQRENTGSGHDAHERNKGSAFHR